MEQTASFTDTQIPPDGHAEPQRLVHGHARKQQPTTSEPRSTTVIRAHSFSPKALFQTASRLADYRDLLYTLSIHRLSVRYKQSLLGPAWALLQPLSLMLIYTVIFSRIA